MSSGTAALRAALAALGVVAGDEVVVPAFTFIATVSAVVASARKPVFAEIDDTLTIDPADVDAKVIGPHRGGRAGPPRERRLRHGGAAVGRGRTMACRCSRTQPRRSASATTGRNVGTSAHSARSRCNRRRTSRPVKAASSAPTTRTCYVRAARFHDQGGQFVTQYRGERRTGSRRAVHGRQPAHDRDRRRGRASCNSDASPTSSAAMRGECRTSSRASVMSTAGSLAAFPTATEQADRA